MAGSSPYRRPPRTLDYGMVARRQLHVVPLRARVEARHRRRGAGAGAWEPEPGPLLRRRQQVATLVTWGLLCVLVFAVFWALAPLLSQVVP